MRCERTTHHVHSIQSGPRHRYGDFESLQLDIRSLSSTPGAAFTVPSAVALIVQSVPEPNAQSQALAAFGAAGAVGNCLGFILGGVITSRIGWKWGMYSLFFIRVFLIPD